MQVGKGGFYLIADFAGAVDYGLKILGGAVNCGGEKFFHADWRATAVDIAGEGQELFGFEHVYGFFANAGGCFFQVKLFVHRKHKYVMLFGFAHRYQRFENLSRILSQDGGDFGSAGRRFVGIAIVLVINFLPVQYSHGIGFEISHLRSVDFGYDVSAILSAENFL